MAFFPRKKRGMKKRGLRKRRSSRRGTKGVSTAVKRYVKKALGRTTENKFAQAFFAGGLESPGSAVFTRQSLYYLGPGFDQGGGYPAGQQLAIDQGAGQAQRIGSSITTKRCILRFVLTPQAQGSANLNPRPQLVTLWIFKLKSGIQDDRQNAANIVASDMFELNNGDTDLNWDLTDLTRPVNTSVMRVLARRTFKLGTAIYDGTGSNPQPLSQHFANNDFKYNITRTMNVTKYVNKKIRFNDNNVHPTTSKTYFMFSCSPADGSSGEQPTGYSPVRVNWYMDYHYEDA